MRNDLTTLECLLILEDLFPQPPTAEPAPSAVFAERDFLDGIGL